MFVRQKKNKSGRVSVQVIDKAFGSYKVAKTIGCSSDPREISEFVLQAKQWISKTSKALEFDFTNEVSLSNTFIDSVTGLRLAGPELLLGKVFDEIGFNQIPDSLFRALVLYRICYPSSKLKTSDYLLQLQGESVGVDQIYRYLDKLHSTQKKVVQNISYKHTRQILGGKIQMLFYDVTTLYFAIKQEDDLRKTGFSKDGKHQNPQIVLGLLVGVNGYPLAYDIFAGNTFEGKTMLPILNRFKSTYGLKEITVVADAGLLSKSNIVLLNDNEYTYILGARIKNESEKIKQQILALNLNDGQTKTLHKPDGTKLIIGYSDKRAKKDKFNRERGLRKLESKIKSGKLTKASINNRGYNKYLKLEGQVSISIDHDKFEKDAKWDGLKGYITNSKLSKSQVVENYRNLWKIERAFRISKSDLKIRPVFHRVQRRIEAHICIVFVAYKVYKELERQLKEMNSSVSARKAIDIAKTIYSLEILTPKQMIPLSRTLLLTDDQKLLAELFGF